MVFLVHPILGLPNFGLPIFGLSFFGTQHLFMVFLVHPILALPNFGLPIFVASYFWDTTSVHGIFGASYIGASYFWASYFEASYFDASYYGASYFWCFLFLGVPFLHLWVIILVCGTFGVSYVCVPIFGRPTSEALNKWDGTVREIPISTHIILV